jgi:glycine cleavage system H protein
MGYTYDQRAKYARTHAWVRLEGELAVIGVSDYAQHQLSDVMSVELPRIGSVVAAGDPIVAVESIKASGDAYSPISGEVVEVNMALEARSDLINQDPYGRAWLAKLRPSRPTELTELMDAPAYEAFVVESETTGGHPDLK